MSALSGKALAGSFTRGRAPKFKLSMFPRQSYSDWGIVPLTGMNRIPLPQWPNEGGLSHLSRELASSDSQVALPYIKWFWADSTALLKLDCGDMCVGAFDSSLKRLQQLLR